MSTYKTNNMSINSVFIIYHVVYHLQKDRLRTSCTKITTITKNTKQKCKSEPQDTFTTQTNIAVVESTFEVEILDKKSPEPTNIVNEHNNIDIELKTCYKNASDECQDEKNGAISLPILSKSRSSRSTSIATLVSPTTPIITAMSTSSTFSWSRERALEQQIETLQETLKDTEERLHSLRLQYDNVSYSNRTMRDKNHQMQDEMERLKIDAQHLHECANMLRTELQAARKDRADAIEVQAMLQRELETARDDKRRAHEEVESNGRQIMDLKRQCKEMERIMARKNPDAMQMLLGKRHNLVFTRFLSTFVHSYFKGVGAKKADDKAQLAAGRRQLEQRIAQLENDAKEQDRKAQLILGNVQSRFSSVQSKYETHISDLETQVLR